MREAKIDSIIFQHLQENGSYVRRDMEVPSESDSDPVEDLTNRKPLHTREI